MAVLLPRNLGARATVASLYIHPVDFIPRMYEQYTRAKLQTLLPDAA